MTTDPLPDKGGLAGHFRDLAHYNAWANQRLLAAVAELPEATYRQDLGGYFRSIHGTLNHLLVMDRLWFGRVAPPAFLPRRHDQILFDRFDELRPAREDMDRRIQGICATLDEVRLAARLAWTSMDGEALSAPLGQVLTHAFNHQTHHRGQIHAMFTRLGQTEPVLDYYGTMFP